MKRFIVLMLVSFPALAQETPILINPIPVPEPGTLALVCGGLGLVLLRALKRKR